MTRARKWLAAALVAAAGVVLLGCPHNNLIDGGGTEGAAGAGRGGSGEVRLIVTNFASDKGPPSRTIAPDSIDLKAQKDNYVFVAEGESTQGETYLEYITLQDDGSTSLSIAGDGVWSLTVSAYDVGKLNGLGMGATATVVMQGQTAQDVKNGGTDALVLQGKAMLDLGMNSTGSVTVTLTNDGVGTDGNVLVSVYFDAGDKTKLDGNGGNDYSVEVGLYDYVTGELVGGDKRDEIKPRGEQLADPEVTNLNDVPKGRYQFRVTVKDLNRNANVAYWTDDIYVEGNRDTTQEVHVSKLFETPGTPAKAGVYWSQKDAGETREGFLAYLTWDGMPFNAVGVDVQIANITEWYKNDGQDKTTFNGGDDVIADASDLWQKIDGLAQGGGNPAFEGVVTELKWSDVPQNAKDFPAIWKEGSLLNGASGVVFLMQTGQVYTVRIRAAGATDNSDWLIVDSASGQALTKPKMLANAADNTGGTDDAKDFNDAKLQKGIFDLVMLKYDLQGKYELFKTTGADKGTKATGTDLVVYKPYGEDITIELKYNNMVTPQANDWFLYPLGAGMLDDRSKGWTGWKGKEDPTKEFNAAVGGAAGNWGSYSGHTDLTLVSVGAGADAVVQAETSGTFNVLTADTVLVDIVATQAGPWTLDELSAGTHATGDVKTTGTGLAEDAANSRYILSLDDAAKNKAGGNATWLYVSVGKDAANPGTLTDKNGNDFTVRDIEVRIIRNGIFEQKTFQKASSSVAYEQLDGIGSGTYELEVRILSSTGYWETFKTPLAIKYDDQTVN